MTITVTVITRTAEPSRTYGNGASHVFPGAISRQSRESGALSKEATDPRQIQKYQDSSDSFSSLADNEE
jgi:hypothetical protein